MFAKIVIAADGSEQSLKAAEQTIELAKKYKSYVFVVYVVDGTTSKSDIISTWNVQGIMEKRMEKLKQVEKWAEAEGIQYEVKIVRGEPAASIVKFAKEAEADLIVIGSRGLNPLQQMVLGSVSHKVVKRAFCPVLVIK
ncbi:universal stress protein [Alkalihalobacillus oceani]|uniref:Universal stress protein n=1 Tax=Halalkalibacter oceani TaxID=1653776 RepID=A0A9X2IPQ6_9BACI|nr:universal stress protein [Halalkalibacter oceani]MCM3714682.1 universal stress protein [Halalkalibacter oceani]